MKLFKYAFLALSLLAVNASLHALNAEFNAGEKLHKSILSPNKQFLITTHSGLGAKLWNIQTGQLFATITDNRGLFFSEDSSTIFSAENKHIDCYTITESGITKQGSITLNTYDFKSDFRTSHTYKKDGGFFKLSAEYHGKYGVFISNVLNKTVTTKEVPRNKIEFYVHTTKLCALSFDAQYAAIACSKWTSGYPYIHIVNLQEEQACNNYFIHLSSIYSMNFSSDKTKLILAASYNRLSAANWYLIVIDLITNKSSWFRQEEEICFADFISDSTILTVSKDGRVAYQELTAEDLAQNQVTNPEQFKVLSSPSEF